MADKKQNNRRNNRNNDEDYNPKFRKMRKKVCALCNDKNLEFTFNHFLTLKEYITKDFLYKKN